MREFRYPGYKRECGCVDQIVCPNGSRTMFVARRVRCARHPLYAPGPPDHAMEPDPPLARIVGAYLVDPEPEPET